jgi:hypothetical protein
MTEADVAPGLLVRVRDVQFGKTANFQLVLVLAARVLL